MNQNSTQKLRNSKTQKLKNLNQGSYQSGQMGLTVTQLAYAFGGSNPSLPTHFS